MSHRERLLIKIECNIVRSKLLALLLFPRWSDCQLRGKIEAIMIGTRPRLRHIRNQRYSYITTFPCLDGRITCRDGIRIELRATPVIDLEHLRGRRQVVACALKGLYTTSARVGRRTSLWNKDLLPSMRKPSGLREIFENCPVPFIAPHEAHCFGRFAER